jgi:alkylation response protein AidB-like acyl-CoA dehydrogenase
MDLSFTPEQEAFREEVRAWAAEAMPPHLKAKAEVDAAFTHADSMQWHKVLAAKGWVAPHWPEEVGGPGLRRHAALHLLRGAREDRRPDPQPLRPAHGRAADHPVRHDSAEGERFLPEDPQRRGGLVPGVLRAERGQRTSHRLRTSAEDAGDHFIVNGQKTWTTYAQYADWIFCLVRTNDAGKKQTGITFLLIDMKTEGLDPKPMLTLSGHSPAFCDTYFDNVEGPEGEPARPAQRRLDPGQGPARARADPRRRRRHRPPLAPPRPRRSRREH